MTATRKPLDLAAFDGLLDPKALCPYCDEYSIPKEIPLLLAECRAQREQIKALREALELARVYMCNGVQLAQALNATREALKVPL